MTKYLRLSLNKSERDDITELARVNPSFYENIYRGKKNYTMLILKELNYVFKGPIPRNFVINMKGGIGRQTGVFKSTVGIQIAKFEIDKTFNIKERVAFTYNDMNDKIKKYADNRQVFVLDERVRDLKVGSEQRLLNIIESCRERQLCFILIGVPERMLTFSDYQLERFGESNDKHLPLKTVSFMIKKENEGRLFYRGLFKWNVIPKIPNFENKREFMDVKIWNSYWRKTPKKYKILIEEWTSMWKEYMKLKVVHQTRAVEQSLTGFDFEKESKKVMDSDEFEKVAESGRIDKAILKNLIYKNYPDVTNEERKMIYTHIISTY